MSRITRILALLAFTAAVHGAPDRYAIQPGDLLHVAVWGDERLNADIRVLPDGSISFPLVGLVAAAGKSVEELRLQMQERIVDFVPDPDVSVTVVEATGSQVYVLGNVNEPGAFPMLAPLTVTRALALAGGPNAFADTNDIRIIRGDGREQRLLKVDYDELLNGSDLSSNHELVAGDTVLIP